eukprot:snap_masked-scaffold_16-processed-gene-1.55-mRNA-1 protein AED:0.05 eAED:0.05 QI:0/-1/0/1/-1/1/1/0/366
MQRIFLTVGASLGGLTVLTISNDEKVYEKILMPIIHKTIDAETAHKLAVEGYKYNLFFRGVDRTEGLKQTVFGKVISSPVGIAAGFDKDGKCVKGLHDSGFGFVEIGSVTPEPQPGNEKPRVFRDVPKKAVVNRYGFNSSGIEKVKQNLIEQNIPEHILLGVNLGKNKTTPNEKAHEDYIKGIKSFSELSCVDYFVINISSPNTPNLRNLQKQDYLREFLDRITAFSSSLNNKKPILLKVSPDLSEEEVLMISEVLKGLFEKDKIQGLIVSNTTNQIPDYLKERDISGGLSGKPLFEKSNKILKLFRSLLGTNILIVGVGGVSSGQDAYDKIRCGANLVQMYTSLVYKGPPVIKTVNRELEDLLKT